DVKRHAARLEAEAVGMVEHFDRHLLVAAELARQWPLGAGAVEQEAAEHLRAGGGAGDLLDLGLAVDGKESHAERIGARDVTLLLDGVAERDALRRRARRERHLDLGDRSGVEAGAKRSEQREQLRRRVCLDGIEHAAVGQRLREGTIVLAHDVEIDDEAGPVLAAAAQEFADALGHGALLTRFNGRCPIEVQAANRPASAGEDASAAVRWRHDGEPGFSPEMLPWLGAGDPFRTAGKDEQASSVSTFGESTRPKKPAPSLL